jgi:hypothetical protein
MTFAVDEGVLVIGGRRFPWAQIFREDLPAPHTFKTRRARLMFENGWTVSIIWGSCTYSSNHDHGLYHDDEFTETPTTVELGIATDRLVDLSSSPEHANLEQYFQGDSVAAYLTADQVLAIIDDVMTWPSPPRVSVE